MSVWCQIEGKTYKNEKISLKRLLKDLFDGEDIVITNGSTIDEFEFRICADSEDANDKIKLFISELNKNKVKYDLTTVVSWVN